MSRPIAHTAIAAAAALAVVGGALATAGAQEIRNATKWGDMNTVSQDLLNRAGSDGNNFLHTNGDYNQLRFAPNRQINTEQRATPAPGLDFPDRREGSDGDGADRRQRRHVPDDVVQPRLRDRRRDRRGILALQAQDGSDHRLLLRPKQPRRRDLRRQGLSGHARLPSWSRSMPRPASSCGRCRSPIRNSATGRRWPRPWSTARS